MINWCFKSLYFGFFFLALNVSVFGCTCDHRVPKCASMTEADEVIAGKIVSLKHSRNEGLKKVRVQVKRQFKGQFQSYKEYFAETGHSCSLDLKVGDKWVFFLFEDEKIGRPVIASCQGSFRIKNGESGPKSLSDFGILENSGSLVLSSVEIGGFLPVPFLKAEVFSSKGELVAEESNAFYSNFSGLPSDTYQLRVSMGHPALQFGSTKERCFDSEIVSGKTIFRKTIKVHAGMCVYRRLKTYRK